MATEPSDLAANLDAPRRKWAGRRAFGLALLVSLLLSFVGVFDHSLWTPDEPRVAEVGREMLVSGNLVVPMLAQKPFLEEPPLHSWLLAASYKLFGVSDGVARLVSALAALLTLLLVFDVLRRMTDPFAALMGTVATATLSGFFSEYHRVVVDPWLSLFVMLGYWGFILAMFPPRAESPERTKPSPWAIGVIYLAGGMAFLTKGPVGPGLIAGPILLFLIAGRRWEFFRSWMHLPGALLFLALCALWPWMLYRNGGAPLMNGFLVDSLLTRFVPSAHAEVKTGHRAPFWYYFLNFPALIMPWLIAVPAIYVWFRRKRVPQEWNRSALLFLAWVFPIGLLLLSAAGTKRGLYLLPVVAPFGAVTGAWLASVAQEEWLQRIDRRTFVVLASLLLLASFCLLIAGLGIAATPHLLGRKLAPLAALIPRMNAILLALVGAAGFALSLRAFSLLRRDSPRAGTLLAGALVGLMAAGAPLVYNSVDQFKNLHLFTADLQKMDAFSPELITFKADEVTVAVVPFDTNHYLKAFDDATEFESYVLQHPTVKLLMLERNVKAIPTSLRGRLHLLYSWGFSGHRAYQLYDFSGASTQGSSTK